MTTDLRPDPALAARARSEAPPLTLDRDAVLGAAHRHVRRRRALRATGMAGGVAAVVAVAVAVAGIHGAQTPAPAEPSPHAQQPHPIGTGRTTALALGLDAVNLLGPASRRDEPFTFGEGAEPARAQRFELGLPSPVDASGGGAASLFVTPPSADGTRLGAVAYGRGDGVSWRLEAPSTDLQVFGVSTTSAQDGRRLDVFELPSLVPSPRLLLGTPLDLTLPDGSTTHMVEVPTFAAPGGRVLAVVQASGTAAAALADDGTHAVLLGGDRSVHDACVSAASCGDPGSIPGLADAVRALGLDLHVGAPQPSGPPTGEQTPSASSASSNSTRGAVPNAVTLATGVYAGTGPYVSTDADGEAGTSTPLGTMGGTTVTLARDGIEFRVRGEHPPVAAAADDAMEVMPRGSMGNPNGASVTSMFDDPRSGMLTAGYAPDLPGVRAFLWSTAPLAGADGRRTHVVELPTFTLPDFAGNPVAVDRRWFVVDVTGTTQRPLAATPSTETGVLFGTPSGKVVDPVCLDHSCPKSTAQSYYDDVAALLAQPAPSFGLR